MFFFCVLARKIPSQVGYRCPMPRDKLPLHLSVLASWFLSLSLVHLSLRNVFDTADEFFLSF